MSQPRPLERHLLTVQQLASDKEDLAWGCTQQTVGEGLPQRVGPRAGDLAHSTWELQPGEAAGARVANQGQLLRLCTGVPLCHPAACSHLLVPLINTHDFKTRETLTATFRQLVSRFFTKKPDSQLAGQCETTSFTSSLSLLPRTDFNATTHNPISQFRSHTYGPTNAAYSRKTDPLFTAKTFL